MSVKGLRVTLILPVFETVRVKMQFLSLLQSLGTEVIVLLVRIEVSLAQKIRVLSFEHLEVFKIDEINISVTAFKVFPSTAVSQY